MGYRRDFDTRILTDLLSTYLNQRAEERSRAVVPQPDVFSTKAGIIERDPISGEYRMGYQLPQNPTVPESYTYGGNIMERDPSTGQWGTVFTLPGMEKDQEKMHQVKFTDEFGNETVKLVPESQLTAGIQTRAGESTAMKELRDLEGYQEDDSVLARKEFLKDRIALERDIEKFGIDRAVLKHTGRRMQNMEKPSGGNLTNDEIAGMKMEARDYVQQLLDYGAVPGNEKPKEQPAKQPQQQFIQGQRYKGPDGAIYILKGDPNLESSWIKQ